jgi:hypothetical protein
MYLKATIAAVCKLFIFCPFEIASHTTSKMQFKIAIEESWTIPEKLANNNPSNFMPVGKVTI